MVREVWLIRGTGWTADMSSKKITLEELLDNIEKNGWVQGFGNLVTVDPDTHEVKNACAIGQGMLNLGIQKIIVDTTEVSDFLGEIVELNDTYQTPIPEIVKSMRESVSKDFLTKNTVTGYTRHEEGPRYNPLARRT